MNPLASRLSRRIDTANRLAGLILIVSLLLLAIAGLGAWHVQRMHGQSEILLSKNIASIRAAVELEMHLQELRHQLDQCIWIYDPPDSHEDARRSFQSMRSYQGQVEGWIHQTEMNAQTQAERAEIQRLKTALSSLFERLDDFVALDDTDHRKARMAHETGTFFEEQVIVPARTYLSLDESLLEKRQVEAAAQSHLLAQILLACGILAATTSMIIGYRFARSISRSLVDLRVSIQDVVGTLSQVTDEVVISTTLDIADVGPALDQVSAHITQVVEQLQARHQEIVHAEQLAKVGQLASGIAHEIRNPLSSMKILIQNAQQLGSGRLDQRDLQILDDEIRRLEVLLTEFLDFAQPKALTLTVTDLASLTESTANFMQPQADRHGVTIECQGTSEPLMARIDSARVRQVIVNLLLNAIEMTPTGGRVRLSIEEQEDFCVLRVQDDGPGVPSEWAERVFEPFFSTKNTGLGLGLAVTRRIVQSHHGDIELDARQTQGAVFVVRLPNT